MEASRGYLLDYAPMGSEVAEMVAGSALRNFVQVLSETERETLEQLLRELVLSLEQA